MRILDYNGIFDLLSFFVLFFPSLLFSSAMSIFLNDVLCDQMLCLSQWLVYYFMYRYNYDARFLIAVIALMSTFLFRCVIVEETRRLVGGMKESGS